MVDSASATGGGNPFTNPNATARQHANANAAFMRTTRPGNSGDQGAAAGDGDPAMPFTTSGEAHRHDPSHPDASLTSDPGFLGPPIPKASQIPKFKL